MADAGSSSPLRHPFTPEEDACLIRTVESRRFPGWPSIATQLPGRTPRQCRERWSNYLSPAIWSGPWTDREDQLLIAGINRLGRAWSTLAASFGGRSENDIKNRWYSHLRYQTVVTDGKIQLAADGQSPDFPNRKRRRRLTPNPKEKAREIIESKAEIASPPRHQFVMEFRVLLVRDS
jgi:hypothetical protein